jgi:hypothetical protein
VGAAAQTCVADIRSDTDHTYIGVSVVFGDNPTVVPGESKGTWVFFFASKL